MTIAHVLVKVGAAEHAATVEFYQQLLKPLGSTMLLSLPNGFSGFGNQKPEYFIAKVEVNPEAKSHVAFGAPGK